MGKSFDTVHVPDRDFTLGGQEFHWRLVQWREFGEWIDELAERDEKEQEKQKEREARAKAIADETGRDFDDVLLELDIEEDKESVLVSFERVISRILYYIEPSEHERFKELVNDPEKRITMLQLNDLRDWLQEVQNERPPDQPSASADGPGTTEATLKVA